MYISLGFILHCNKKNINYNWKLDTFYKKKKKTFFGILYNSLALIFIYCGTNLLLQSQWSLHVCTNNSRYTWQCLGHLTTLSLNMNGTTTAIYRISRHVQISLTMSRFKKTLHKSNFSSMERRNHGTTKCTKVKFT